MLLILDFDVDHMLTANRIDDEHSDDEHSFGSQMSLKAYCYSVICMYCFINFCSVRCLFV